MVEEYYSVDSKAPFNMAIATLLSLRLTLDKIRDIESDVMLPPEERQRIKIELVKRFYVDSTPLLEDKPTIIKYEYILSFRPQLVKVYGRDGKLSNRIRYSYDLNYKLDICLREIQRELQKRKYFMPPRDDMSMIAGKMS